MGRPLNKHLFMGPGDTIKAHATVVGDNAVRDATIHEQTATRTFVMTTTAGTSLVKLVTTDSLDPGEAYILATDANGSTYYVSKITSHRVKLIRKAMVGSYLFANNASARWTFDAAADLVVQVEKN